MSVSKAEQFLATTNEVLPTSYFTPLPFMCSTRQRFTAHQPSVLFSSKYHQQTINEVLSECTCFRSETSHSLLTCGLRNPKTVWIHWERCKWNLLGHCCSTSEVGRALVKAQRDKSTKPDGQV